MRLWLTPEQAQNVIKHAQEEFPHEACGLIAGIGEQVTQIIPIPNSASDPIHQYRMEERSLTEALFLLSNSSLSLVGFYHSHPNSAPIPSSTDIEQALYPDTPYLIVSMRNHKAELAAWSIHYGEVSRIEVYIGIMPLPKAEVTLSKAQKTAVILSAVLVFIFMIVVSLSLLPPAPIIIAPLAK